jgi:hypothetical protein
MTLSDLQRKLDELREELSTFDPLNGRIYSDPDVVISVGGDRHSIDDVFVSTMTPSTIIIMTE